MPYPSLHQLAPHLTHTQPAPGDGSLDGTLGPVAEWGTPDHASVLLGPTLSALAWETCDPVSGKYPSGHWIFMPTAAWRETGSSVALPGGTSDKCRRHEGMATHSSTLSWRIPWTEELQSIGSQRIGHDVHVGQGATLWNTLYVRK